MNRARWFVVPLLLPAALAPAQDRDTRVRDDRRTSASSQDWIYNDLARATEAAKASGKPLLVVFRCIPCEACQEFDDDVARRDPVISDLLDRFVCARIVQANAMDLTRFRHDFDLSFAAYLMHPDGTIYARYGTRSERPEEQDITLEGLRAAMEGALRLHANHAAVKPALAGKRVGSSKYRTPRDYPSLAGKYSESLDYEGSVARSCIHCHQIREAERLVFRSAGRPIPDEVLFPNPDPGVLGLKLDPSAMARVERVTPGSIADRTGLRPGDDIVTLGGQPILSIADVQWVLQNTPDAGVLPAEVRRDGMTSERTLELPPGWRRGDISWRATTWDLRRMALGGLYLEEIADGERAALGIPPDRLALRVRHAGEYGEHADARNAGVRKGDLLVAHDGREDRRSESELIAHGVQEKRPGDPISVTVLRDGRRLDLGWKLR